VSVLRRINTFFSLVKFGKELKKFYSEDMDKNENNDKVSSNGTTIEMGDNGNGLTGVT